MSYRRLILPLVLLAIPALAADVSISNLPSASTISGTEVTAVVQGGATKKATATQLATYVRSVVTKSDVGLGNVDNTSNVTERAATATLTNKTISAASNTITGLTKSDVGLGNVDNTSNATERAATATLSGKTISGSSNTLTNIGNSSLTNSAITINGTSTSLGGSRSLSLASSDFANQGTTTTVLHGNASGNPSFGSVNLATDVTGTLSATGLPALTGDVTSSSGSAVTSIAAGAVTDAKSSLAVKPAVTVVATTNQTLSGTPTIDGQATAVGSVVLLTAQTTGSENGPWVAAAGAWSRPTWYASGSTTQAFQFITTLVRLGTTYQGTTWRQTGAGPITVDTTSTTWAVVPYALNSSTVTGSIPDANLSANVGLINGTPTWTGLHTWSSTEPRIILNESDQSTDLNLWDLDVQGGVLKGRTRTTADGTGKDWLSIPRGTTTAISSISWGNATDNPPYNFLGTGTATFNGSVDTAMRIRFTANSTANGDGIYKTSTNTLAVSLNSVNRFTLSTSGLTMTTAGYGLLIKEGTNATMGTCTLVAGTCTVSTTKVTATSRIWPASQADGGTPGFLRISSRTAGTSFVITSGSATDTSTVAWQIIEPAP